jgi:hypothetical protein
MCSFLQLAWKQVPTKLRSKFFSSDWAITFGIHVFWVYECATGVYFPKSGPQDLQNQWFLLIFSVFWPSLSGFSVPYGFTSGHERECNYTQKVSTEVSFNVNWSWVIGQSLTFLFRKFTLYSKLGSAGALPSAGRNAHTNARDAPTAPRSNISALRLTIKQILLSVLLERNSLIKGPFKGLSGLLLGPLHIPYTLLHCSKGTRL